MADNKTKRGARDRSRIAAGEAYEVNYFARKAHHALQVIEMTRIHF